MEDGYKPCPYCAEPIREAATVCRYCNRTLVATAPIPTAQCPLEYDELKITLEKKFGLEVVLGTHSY